MTVSDVQHHRCLRALENRYYPPHINFGATERYKCFDTDYLFNYSTIFSYKVNTFKLIRIHQCLGTIKLEVISLLNHLQCAITNWWNDAHVLGVTLSCRDWLKLGLARTWKDTARTHWRRPRRFLSGSNSARTCSMDSRCCSGLAPFSASWPTPSRRARSRSLQMITWVDAWIDDRESCWE